MTLHHQVILVYVKQLFVFWGIFIGYGFFYTCMQIFFVILVKHANELANRINLSRMSLNILLGLSFRPGPNILIDENKNKHSNLCYNGAVTGSAVQFRNLKEIMICGNLAFPIYENFPGTLFSLLAFT